MQKWCGWLVKLEENKNDQGQINILSEYIGYCTTQTSHYRIILIVGGLIMFILKGYHYQPQRRFLADLNYRHLFIQSILVKRNEVYNLFKFFYLSNLIC